MASLRTFSSRVQSNLLPSEMARIDRARMKAFREACAVMPHEEAHEHAAETAEREHAAILTERAIKARRPFGSGILPYVPEHRLPVTLADAEWWSRASNPDRDDAYDFDFWAAQSEALDRLTEGCLL